MIHGADLTPFGELVVTLSLWFTASALVAIGTYWVQKLFWRRFP